MSSNQKASVGRVVHYHPNLDDIVKWQDAAGGSLPHNTPREGEPLAALVTQAFSDDMCNLTVFLDSEVTVRAWSASCGEPGQPGRWSWPPRV